MWLKNYGNLYRKLITSSGEIPIGLYRTINESNRPERSSVIYNKFRLIKRY